MSRSFASDNNAGVHPEVLEAIATVNAGHVVAYGEDPYTSRAVALMRDRFGNDIEVFFVFGGTGANVLGLKAITQSHHAVICSEAAHINVDECGAPEHYTGCKLLPIATDDGKITVGRVASRLGGLGDEHRSQPRVVSISQSTELGSVYSASEIEALARFAQNSGLLVHMDGARLANAAVSLGAELDEITGKAGVDVLSFGGTKNGMMYGEAVIFFRRDLARDFKFIRKQGMQLSSKMRFIAAQFTALLSNDLWRRNALHANQMAQMLAEGLKKLPPVKITQPVDANGVFAVIPSQFLPALKEKYFFYTWNESTSEVRLMTSFDTTEEDVNGFVRYAEGVMGES